MASPYREISAMMLKLNINDDSIVLDKKIRDLTEDFKFIVSEDDFMLKDALAYFNTKALDDHNFAMNFALFFSSRTLDSIVLNGSKIRAEMLNVLQQNFTNANELKSNNSIQFYNSITLLGEYYHRARIADKPVRVLGQSLLQLLTEQLKLETERMALEPDHIIDAKFIKLILSQISLNGLLARPSHKTEIDALLFEIRKCLIEVPALPARSKAMFLMTLDLYYSNFMSVGRPLEKLYSKFLIEDNEATAAAAAAAAATANPTSPPLSPTKTASGNVNSISGLRSELRGIGNSLGLRASGSTSVGGPSQSQASQRINKEYVARPLKASERLKYMRIPAAAPEQRVELDEMAQEKLFEQQFEDMRARSEAREAEKLAAEAAKESSDATAINHAAVTRSSSTPPTNNCPSSTNTNTPPTNRTKERRADKAHFLARSMSSRQRLKLATTTPSTPDGAAGNNSSNSSYNNNNSNSPTSPTTPSSQRPPEPTDWFAEVESSERSLSVQTAAAAAAGSATIYNNQQISPQSIASTHSSQNSATLPAHYRHKQHHHHHHQQQNYHSNSDRENAKNHLNTSPPSRPHSRASYTSSSTTHEQRRGGNALQHTHSFRSNKSDRSTQSMDRNLESSFEFKIFENRRNNYRNNGGGGGNNNYGSQTWGRGNRRRGENQNNNNNKDNYQSYDRRQDSYKNGAGGSYNNFGRKSPMPGGSGGGGGGGSGKYQRQPSVESEGGIQKRFNLQNNRQYNNSTSSFGGGSSGGGRGSSRYYKNQQPQQQQQQQQQRPLSRSMSRQSDDGQWTDYNQRYLADDGRVTPNASTAGGSSSLQYETFEPAQYSQDFLRYIDN